MQSMQEKTKPPPLPALRRITAALEPRASFCMVIRRPSAPLQPTILSGPRLPAAIVTVSPGLTREQSKFSVPDPIAKSAATETGANATYRATASAAPRRDEPDERALGRVSSLIVEPLRWGGQFTDATINFAR